MTSPTNLKYTKTHEWVLLDGDVATIGVTDYAQTELGDITYLDLPEVGAEVQFATPFGFIESVKAASDVYAPLDGEIIELNDEVSGSPELINTSPYEKAWLVKIRIADPAQIDGLMDPAAYDAFAAASRH